MFENPAVLRIYTDESAYFGDRTIPDVVMARARAVQLAGVTVFRAVAGLGHTMHTHRRHFLERERAVVIEIIDSEASLREFAEALSDLPDVGLIALQRLEVLRSLETGGEPSA